MSADPALRTIPRPARERAADALRDPALGPHLRPITEAQGAEIIQKLGEIAEVMRLVSRFVGSR